MIQSLAYYTTIFKKNFTDYSNEVLTKLGLSQGTLFFILYVGKHPNCSPKQLAQGLNMDVGHTTRTLVKLEQGNFIVQDSNPKDKRAHVLNLTEKGKEAFQISHEIFYQWDQKMMNALNQDEQIQLLSLLGKITESKKGELDVRVHI